MLVVLGAACDPVYDYCVAVTRCGDGAPVEDVSVRFDHEGLYDSRTDAEGKTCAGNVGSPRAHDVRIELEKDGFEPLVVTTRSRELDWGGRGLDVAVCVCEQDEAECKGGIVMIDPDAGDRSDGSMDGGNP